MNDTLETLIHARLDGEITPEEHAQLEGLLRESWQARRLYLELADQHARLLQQPTLNTGRLQPPASHPSSPRTGRGGPSRWLLPTTIATAAAAIALPFILRPR
ncbi:MAG: hypothetical protein ACO1TE_00865, partial [Prosthecobacter sp.]